MKRYELKTFVRYLTNDLLEQYFKSRDFPFDQKLDTSAPETLKTYINNLEETVSKEINIDFANANEISTEHGILTLVDLLKDNDINIQDEIANLENYQCQALYVLTNYRDLFEDASILYYVEDLRGKTERKGVAHVNINKNTLIERTKDLEYALRTHLMSRDGRGQNCQIEVYPYEDRICFLAYPEDHLKAQFQYVKNKLVRTTTKPVFEIIWIYYPKIRKIELSCNFRGKRITELLKMFGEIILEDLTGIDEQQKTYNFNEVLSPEFNLFGELADSLEYTRLTQLRLSNKYANKDRITFETASENEDGMFAMRETIKRHNIDAKFWNVTQATFKLKFEGKGNRGSVTMRISYPDRCNLSDTPTHLKAKKYLNLWGLENNGIG